LRNGGIERGKETGLRWRDEMGLGRGEEARRGLNYGKRGRRRIVDGGKNASVEKNYPIMPKARRNYERWHT